MKHYRDYVWKNGIPYGCLSMEAKEIQEDQTTYKIVMDPYKKRISIEKYKQLEFIQLVYDSALLDFRALKPLEHTAWQKTLIKETPCNTVSVIRNQDDRIVFFEECFYEGDYCRECRITSPHGILLSVHQISYQALNDSDNTVRLFDANEHLVMYKRYSANKLTGDFDKLISEVWDLEKQAMP